MLTTFVLFPNIDQAEKFKKYLNKKHKNMSFTLEVEKNNTLHLVDNSGAKSHKH